MWQAVLLPIVIRTRSMHSTIRTTPSGSDPEVAADAGMKLIAFFDGALKERVEVS